MEKQEEEGDGEKRKGKALTSQALTVQLTQPLSSRSMRQA